MGRTPVCSYSVVRGLFCITILAVACVRATAAPLSPAGLKINKLVERCPAFQFPVELFSHIDFAFTVIA
ncbi:hypothetical protein EYY97_11835 [Hafnia paralvei]|nr:hypothetical protein EYY97_11835 [Hafnia paralvei]